MNYAWYGIHFDLEKNDKWKKCLESQNMVKQLCFKKEGMEWESYFLRKKPQTNHYFNVVELHCKKLTDHEIHKWNNRLQTQKLLEWDLD